jgi:SAM-dependent methyltransferase
MGSADVQGELWGRAPVDWLALQEGFSVPLWDAMLTATGVEGGVSVLDAGCGTGGASVLARQRGASVTGLDASEGLLDLARRRVPDADFRIGDLESLPFEDGVFDAAIAASSIQYADDPGRAIEELSRVLKPGGRVAVGLFSTPDKVEYRVVFEAIRSSLPDPPEGEGPFALSRPGALEDLVSAAGMSVIQADEVDCPFTFPDIEAFWKGCISAGPVQAALKKVDARDLRRKVEEAAVAYQRPDGSIRFEVAFRYLSASEE